MKPSENAVDQAELITSDLTTQSAIADVLSDAKLHCERCGYDWTPQAGPPRQCALCRSAYWMRPLPFIDPEEREEHWRKSQARSRKRRQREVEAFQVRRLRKAAAKVGKDSVAVIREMYPFRVGFDDVIPEVKPRPNMAAAIALRERAKTGMPPPPSFDEDAE